MGQNMSEASHTDEGCSNSHSDENNLTGGQVSGGGAAAGGRRSRRSRQKERACNILISPAAQWQRQCIHVSLNVRLMGLWVYTSIHRAASWRLGAKLVCVYACISALKL
mmetsp:Transcript_30089/g.77622  ORF Transcript_30089/g.77622 Transcript_30089/m.77622 type:complete len:109 (+) Transcript_30089:236-562(+)